MRTDVLIVGGGLAGLSVADRLAREGVDFLLVEAADRLGGRIMSPVIGCAAFDLGPAWFWPGQPRVAALTQRLGLRVFDQYATGAIVFQDRTGAVHRNKGFASMQGSKRVDGGMGAVVDGLAELLPPDRVRLAARVASLSQKGDRIEATIASGGDGATVSAARVVLAVPPRVVAETISFAPPLAPAEAAAMKGVPTWMAGQAKIVAVYDRPHWRDAGLSGDAMSHRGPMVEIHDASPADGGPYALFGFVGVPAAARSAHAALLVDAAREQLVELFGPALAAPIEIRLQDWATEPLIATSADQAPMHAHPAYGVPSALADLWDGRLVMASSEMGGGFGGFLEGALEAADAAVDQLVSSHAVAVEPS